MAETSPTQLINDWLAAAKSATKANAPTVATTLAGYYTSDAVLCAAEGIIKTKSAIEQDYARNFGFGFVVTGISNQSINPGPPPPGTTTSNWAWAYGQWNGNSPFPPPSGPVTPLSGNWSILLVNKGSTNNPDWLIQQHTIATNQVT
jgi:hypothetical protein